MCKDSLFIPESVKSRNSFLSYFKITKELSEFRNYLIHILILQTIVFILFFRGFCKRNTVLLSGEGVRSFFGVGLSNICYTILNKFLQDRLRGFPSQRSHGELIIVPAVIYLQLPGKSPERNKTYEKHKNVRYLCDDCVPLFRYAGV